MVYIHESKSNVINQTVQVYKYIQVYKWIPVQLEISLLFSLTLHLYIGYSFLHYLQ